MKLLPSQARQQGYTIDDHCYPWFAYKGPRFLPETSTKCFTDLEEQALKAVEYLYGRAHPHRRLANAAEMEKIASMMRAVADEQLKGIR